jgi:hypothetical protein
MKNLLLPLIALVISAGVSAQTVDTQSQKLIETFVKSNIEMELEAVDPAAVSKVFVGKFFKIMVSFVETGVGASSCGDHNFVNINGTAVSMVEPIHMDLECPVMLSLIKKDFLLKDENGAKLFEAALNVVCPVEAREMPNVKHLKKGSQWIFLRGKFFDDYTAYIVTTNPAGTIVKIELELGYTLN